MRSAFLILVYFSFFLSSCQTLCDRSHVWLSAIYPVVGILYVRTIGYVDLQSFSLIPLFQF